MALKLTAQQLLNSKWIRPFDKGGNRLALVLKPIFTNVSYHILVASLTLMANRAIRVRLAASI